MRELRVQNIGSRWDRGAAAAVATAGGAHKAKGHRTKTVSYKNLQTNDDHYTYRDALLDIIFCTHYGS